MDGSLTLFNRLEKGFFRGLRVWTCLEEGPRQILSRRFSKCKIGAVFSLYLHMLLHCFRQQNTASSETIWAGALPHPADIGVSTSADSGLGSLTSYFQSSVSIACKAQEILAEPFGVVDKCMPVTPCTELVPVIQETACEDTGEGETMLPSPECSICLERCGDVDGLIQLRCKHLFHSACLGWWLRSHGDCPYCRASVLRTSDE
uniref:Uncharacterized protein n=1 Tax=Avena sativa TaxID=4498 RepID=A0ACD5Y9M7_AVESA